LKGSRGPFAVGGGTVGVAIVAATFELGMIGLGRVAARRSAVRFEFERHLEKSTGA